MLIIVYTIGYKCQHFKKVKYLHYLHIAKINLYGIVIVKLVVMENIKIAEFCGLCNGCKNAINKALETSKTYKNVTIFKELVHNPIVNKMLLDSGIKYANSLYEINSDDMVILRTHGEPLSTYIYLKQNNIAYKDCTCPKVKQIHAKVAKYSQIGYQVVIIGKHKNNKEIHPEVAGTLGWSISPAIVIETDEDLQLISNNIASSVYVVCQTTFNKKKAEELINKIQLICAQKHVDLLVDKTLCDSQQIIKESSKKLAKQCDIMFVVGGKNSSNTQELFNELYEIKPTIFLHDINHWQQELKKQNITILPTTKIGITAGASTPLQELSLLKEKIANSVKFEQFFEK